MKKSASVCMTIQSAWRSGGVRTSRIIPAVRYKMLRFTGHQTGPWLSNGPAGEHQQGILDDIRCVMGGSEVVEAFFSLGKLTEAPAFKDCVVKMQRWPRDIDLRKGLLSSTHGRPCPPLSQPGTRTYRTHRCLQMLPKKFPQ
jgi:hypothetical protein